MVRSEKSWWLWSFYMAFFFGSDGFAERVFFFSFWGNPTSVASSGL